MERPCIWLINLESLNTDPQFRWQRWSSGRAPRGPTEIGLSSHTLKGLRIRLGDAVALNRPDQGRSLFRVVGVVDTRGSIDRQSSAYGIVTDETARRFAGISGPNTVMVKADPTPTCRA